MPRFDVAHILEGSVQKANNQVRVGGAVNQRKTTPISGQAPTIASSPTSPQAYIKCLAILLSTVSSRYSTVKGLVM